MSYCQNCGNYLSEEDRFCGKCGTKVGADSNNTSKSVNGESILGSLNDYMGNTKPVTLNWKDLFSEVFKKHTTAEAEDIFICGTQQTTPLLSEVSSTWPKPWLYSRIFGVLTVTFILLKICWDIFGNTNAIPGIIVIGSFTVPLTTLILFLEVNAFRNISFYHILSIFLVGGGASLVTTLFLFTFLDPGQLDFIGACIVGVVEEVGKLIIVYYFVKHIRGCNFILNGLLVGAAVGAGFAAFESAGYAFTFLWQSADDSVMMNVIYLRAFLSPGGHVAWAAVTGAALVLVKGNKPLTSSVFSDTRFWKIFLIPVVLHSIWDMPINIGTDIYLIPILLTIAIWVVVMIFINMGLNEVEKYKKVDQ